MKEFFEDVKKILKEEKEEKEEKNTFKELGYDFELEKELKKELEEESKKEMKMIKLSLLIMAIIIIICGTIIFIFRKNIANGFVNVVDNIISKSTDFIEKNEDKLPDFLTNKCSVVFPSTYSLEYTDGVNNIKESITLLEDGSYTRIYNDYNSTGSYTIKDKEIILRENSNDLNYIYKLNNDCSSVSRVLTDGTTIVLKKE